jgi:hypothetical protein
MDRKQRISKGFGIIVLAIFLMIPLSIPFGLELLFLYKGWTVAFYIVGITYLIYPVHSFFSGRFSVVWETIVGALPAWAIINRYLLGLGLINGNFELIALIVCLATNIGFLIDNIVKGIDLMFSKNELD